MIAILIVVGSLRLPVGTVTNPGPGFWCLLMGIGLAVTSILLFIITLSKKFPENNALESNALSGNKSQQWYRIIFTSLLMFVWAIALSRLGYLITTFLLMFTLLKVVGKLNWKVSLGVGILTVFLSYMLFKVWLQVELPVGPWGM
jgi:hypothetical protein